MVIVRGNILLSLTSYSKERLQWLAHVPIAVWDSEETGHLQLTHRTRVSVVVRYRKTGKGTHEQNILGEEVKGHQRIHFIQEHNRH